jgi:hypothetical protein
MMTKSSLAQPPRLAVWLMSLFTTHEQSETILGDLLEESSDLALRSGGTFARRWYWRQSLRTTAHLIGAGFRVAPWQIAGAVVGCGRASSSNAWVYRNGQVPPYIYMKLRKE